ncbi:MAG: hypothetical protein QW607_04195 [Desulfurococcaceae archaeon]
MVEVDFKDVKLHEILSKYNEYVNGLMFIDGWKKVENLYNVLHSSLGNLLKIRNSTTKDDAIVYLVLFYHDVLTMLSIFKEYYEANLLETLSDACVEDVNSKHLRKIGLMFLNEVISETMHAVSDFCVEFYNHVKYEKKKDKNLLIKKLCKVINGFTQLKSVYEVSDKKFLLYYLTSMACKLRGDAYSLIHTLYKLFSGKEIVYIIKNIENVEDTFHKVLCIVD